jgi:hypothetical protein
MVANAGEADVSPSIISSLTADAIPMLETFTRNFPIIGNGGGLGETYPTQHPVYPVILSEKSFSFAFSEISRG